MLCENKGRKGKGVCLLLFLIFFILFLATQVNFVISRYFNAKKPRLQIVTYEPGNGYLDILKSRNNSINQNLIKITKYTNIT